MSQQQMIITIPPHLSILGVELDRLQQPEGLINTATYGLHTTAAVAAAA